MKHRLLDLLRCSCGSSEFALTDLVIKEVPFSTGLPTVMCRGTCAFRKCLVTAANVTPGDCTECYKHEILAGSIQCQCSKSYPIAGGIPRFLPDDMSSDLKKAQAAFSLEWRFFRFGERNWGQDIEFRKRLFLRGMGVGTPDSLRGKLILDAGCGSGVLAIEMARSFGMEVVALDLASGIQRAYEQNDNAFVYFVQGSVLELPLRNHAFDYLYCAGVLVACPDTEAGFRAIIRTLRPHGRCFIWVYHPIDRSYHPNDLMKMRLYNWLRKHVSPLPSSLQYSLFVALIPLFWIKRLLERMLGVDRGHLTWREKMQNFVDSFSPVYQNRHTPSEVLEWFSGEGFTGTEVSDTGPYGFGVRGDLGPVVRGEDAGGISS